MCTVQSEASGKYCMLGSRSSIIVLTTCDSDILAVCKGTKRDETSAGPRRKWFYLSKVPGRSRRRNFHRQAQPSAMSQTATVTATAVDRGRKWTELWSAASQPASQPGTFIRQHVGNVRNHLHWTIPTHPTDKLVK